MKKPILILSLTAFLYFSQLSIGNAQFVSFTEIDTSIVCTIGGYSCNGTFGDFNNDGLDDLLIINTSNTTESNSHFLFLNNGNWKFTQVTEGNIADYKTSYGAHGANWGDYDNDGNLDLFIANHNQNNNALFKNNGDGSFTMLNEGFITNIGGDSGPATWIDIENDGYLDLYISNQQQQKNFLFHNNGDGSFTKLNTGSLVNFVVAEDLGPYAVDIDNDGDADIFGTPSFDKNYLYINDGDGNFAPRESGTILDNGHFSTFCGWGDYNNDSYTDVFIPTWNLGFITGDYDLLYLNNGDGTFSNIAGTAPVNEKVGNDDGAWADFDNDGHLDLFTCAIYEAKNCIYKNNGDGTFTRQDIEALTGDIGGHTSLSDMNNDGFIDILVARGYSKTGPTENLIYANNGNSNNWITIRLNGTMSNKLAIGAKVRAKATIGGTPVWQSREIGLSGLAGHTNAYFGFGNATLIDSLWVKWPSGHDTILTDVETNQIMTITEIIPEGYLRASFTVDTTIGRGELTVRFKDLSRFDPAQPVTSWSWDFDGDGTEDSDLQNPVYTFMASGGDLFDITLIVSNDVHSDTITRKDFIRLFPLSAENLAQWAIATAHTTEFPNANSQNTVDGEILSRWASNTTDSSWLKLELDSVYTLGKVIIHWEDAYAEKYEVQTSLDNSDWKTVYCNNSGDGLTDTIKFTGADAKYMKINMLQSTLIGGKYFGYSIYEVEIYRSDGNQYDANCVTDIYIQETQKADYLNAFPNPAVDRVNFEFTLSEKSEILLDIFDIAGRKVANLANGKLDAGKHILEWDGTGFANNHIPAGIYIYKFTISNNADIINHTGRVLFIE